MLYSYVLHGNKTYSLSLLKKIKNLTTIYDAVHKMRYNISLIYVRIYTGNPIPNVYTWADPI